MRDNGTIKNITYESHEMWRLPRVIQCVGLCKSSIYGLIKKGQFPQPIKLTEKASAWKASSVISWIKSREDLS